MDDEDFPKKHVKKYSGEYIGSHWLIMILTIILLISGGIPFYNWFMVELNIHDVGISEMAYSISIHKFVGMIFILVIVFYLNLMFSGGKADIISKNPEGDVKSFYSLIAYIIGFSNRGEIGEGDKYSRSQRGLFVLFIYTIGLVAISGSIMLYRSYSSGVDVEPSLGNAIFMTHILSVFMFLLLGLIFVGSLLRRLDGVAVRAMLLDGKIPLWYIKKNHKEWYQEQTSDSENLDEN